MSGTTLRDFVRNAVEMNRIWFADLRRLQRDILPYRITTQEQAEMVLSLDIEEPIRLRLVDASDRPHAPHRETAQRRGRGTRASPCLPAQQEKRTRSVGEN